MPTEAARADEVIAFWRGAGPEKWFAKDAAFDETCRQRFLTAWEAAGRGELDHWAETPEGALGLVILLDQMPRNMFRNDARTWSTDPQALAAAQAAIARGFDKELEEDMRVFLYLPFEHAEDIEAQRKSVALFEALGRPEQLHWARHHLDIVERFGRFPHRNAVLGRESTPEELAFLEVDDFRG
ncbi:DUF924 family protein [Enterovirga rhinocerotis]|uniref:Uncharacterized protein (DUF924 family) n=1 Tax=Enterovirga rhinocerotis TaxID=1339210 RepID=A0A4R7BXY6_9HYPH|nr:DUF924 family protein [Enterovirga rhinocerotis]TDR89067.1 uncharacterized protein (DUF924 family) [Enterovirga rhinocerotis]